MSKLGISTSTIRHAAAVALLSSAAWLAAGAANAAELSPGVPDLSSNNLGFQANSVFFHAEPGAKYKPIAPPAEHPYCGNRDLRQCPKGQLPAYGDWKNPILKPAVAAQLHKISEEILSGKQDVYYQAMARCWPGGVPGIMAFTAQPAYFLQGPKEVTILYSRGPNIRHVYLGAEHTKNPKLSWYGESVGHYEGDSLVIDTIGLNDKTAFDFFHTPHSTKLHVVERYKIVPYGLVIGGRDSINKVGPMVRGDFTADDPDSFVAPLSGWNDYTISHNAIADSESICAENNDANYFGENEAPIPQTKRPDF